MLGLIGKKLGMTQIFKDDGSVVPVTVVRVAPNVVLDIKTTARNGYNAVALASEPQKEHRLNKAEKGQFAKAGVAPSRVVKEFRTEQVSDFAVGRTLGVSVLAVGEYVTVQGRSKGKGFQGVMKRYHFSGGNDSHGNSISHRAPGSIGCRTWPGRVIKGKRMAGHMGDETVSVKNLEVVGIEPDQNLVLIKGAVPGSKQATIYITPQAAEFEKRAIESIKVA